MGDRDDRLGGCKWIEWMGGRHGRSFEINSCGMCGLDMVSYTHTKL